MSRHEAVGCPQFRDAVTEYLEGALSPGDRETFEGHRSRCQFCREYLDDMLDCIEGLGWLCVDDLTTEREAELVDLIRRRRQTEPQFARSGEASPHEMLKELMAHSPEQRQILIENTVRFRSVELCQLALERGFELGWQQPAKALELTSLAVVIADSLDKHCHPPGTISDLRAKSYASLGNARRIGSDLAGAGRALGLARNLVANEFTEPSVKATVLSLHASLQAAECKYEAAFETFGLAIALFREIGELRGLVEATIALALSLTDSGRPRSGVRVLTEIRILADEANIPRLSLALRHNLALSLLACGRSDEARRLIPEVKRLHMSLGNTVDLIRFKWLEGRVVFDSGRMDGAEALFLEVKQFFVERGMAHDVGLVSLDLALVYLRQGRVAGLKALSSEMLTIFSSLKVHPEALAALVFCRKAIEAERVTVGLTGELTKRLEEARERAAVGVGLSVAEESPLRACR